MRSLGYTSRSGQHTTFPTSAGLRGQLCGRRLGRNARGKRRKMQWWRRFGQGQGPPSESPSFRALESLQSHCIDSARGQVSKAVMEALLGACLHTADGGLLVLGCGGGISIIGRAARELHPAVTQSCVTYQIEFQNGGRVRLRRLMSTVAATRLGLLIASLDLHDAFTMASRGHGVLAFSKVVLAWSELRAIGSSSTAAMSVRRGELGSIAPLAAGS